MFIIINVVLTLSAAILFFFFMKFARGDAGSGEESSAGRNSGRKWKNPFPAKVSGSERLVYYNGLMDPPGCLLSLHYIGEMLTKAKLASLLVS